jgi:HD superfamily phosphohydrolase
MNPSSALERLELSVGFKTLIASVEEIVAPQMTHYCTTQGGDFEGTKTKAIKDAVWGMIDLEHREVAVLGSPPLQRLRRIRQLGVGYLTYPTAGYSRFEHTIGAVFQADRMVRAVAKRTGRLVRDGNQTSVTGESEVMASLSAVRLAALLHDVGHMPLSHVSERYFNEQECPSTSKSRAVIQICTEVQAALDVKPPTLSECLSLAIVLAPSFWRFLIEEVRYEPHVVAAAALAIVGRPPSSRQAFVSQMITNVVDADKLDYMFRDSFATGVPLAVDLERLLFKLKCLELDSGEMTDELLKMRDNEDPALVLGVDLAGEQLAYDVAIARTMLFERVYLHHKTRAAERVALRLLGELDPDPADLLAHDDGLFDGLGVAQDHCIMPYVRMLRSRQLPRRAYAISHRFLSSQAIAPPGQQPELSLEAGESWRRLTADLSHPNRRSVLEGEILNETTQIGERLGLDANVTGVWVDTQPTRGDLGTWELWVEYPDGITKRAQTYGAKASAYAHSPSQTFFVYVSGEGGTRLNEVTFLATELVIARNYGLVAGRAAADYSKLQFRKIEQLKHDLIKCEPSIYKTVGRLRPEPRFLQSTATQSRIDSLEERFGHYGAQAKVRVDSGRINAFLRQFPEPTGEEMLGVLEHMAFIGRDALGTSLAGFISGGAADDELYVTLTTPPDKSASHLPYFFGDSRDHKLQIASLDEALTDDRPITFFDDCHLSGSQSRTVLQTWLGLDRELDEQLTRTLTEDQRVRLLGRRIRFRFAYGWEKSLLEFESYAEDLGLGRDVAAQLVEHAAAPLVDRASASPELVEFLREVGTDLLCSTKGQENKAKWTPARCRDFALGYGDLQQLVSLVYNTPTGTVTALWKGGRYGGSPWLPLLPRRNEPGVLRRSTRS